jgi:hypothetical protein
MMARYIATLRAQFNADDDVEAIWIADKIMENGEVDLNEDDGDLLEVTQVTSNALDITPQEVLVQLRRARNLLIRTRIKQCFETARELDKIIYALSHRDEINFDMSSYDWGAFMQITEQIIKGEEPNE